MVDLTERLIAALEVLLNAGISIDQASRDNARESAEQTLRDAKSLLALQSKIETEVAELLADYLFAEPRVIRELAQAMAASAITVLETSRSEGK